MQPLDHVALHRWICDECLSTRRVIRCRRAIRRRASSHQYGAATHTARSSSASASDARRNRHSRDDDGAVGPGDLSSGGALGTNRTNRTNWTNRAKRDQAAPLVRHGGCCCLCAVERDARGTILTAARLKGTMGRLRQHLHYSSPHSYRSGISIAAMRTSSRCGDGSCCSSGMNKQTPQASSVRGHFSRNGWQSSRATQRFSSSSRASARERLTTKPWMPWSELPTRLSPNAKGWPRSSKSKGSLPRRCIRS